MARTALVPKILTANGGIVNMLNDGTNFTAVDNTNGHTIAIPTTGIPAGSSIDRLILLVLNTNAAGRIMTIRAATSDGGSAKLGAGAGNGPAFTYPSFEGGKGDVAYSAMTATTGIGIFGPFEIARFMQPDGTVSIDFNGATGFIAAILLPRAF
ncbi:MAG: hypothetical protein ACRDHZ_02405 [Ktedonobacteraceae bacterium]